MPKDTLAAGAEPWEWPAEFGTGAPDADAFACWCADVGITGFASIRSMRIAHDEFALLTGRQHLSDRKLSRLVKGTSRIKSWRDRKLGNVTRYRIIHARADVIPFAETA